MKERYVKILVFVGCSLLALIAVQIVWMTDAWKLKNKEFDKTVTTVLTELSTNFEDDLFCNEVFTNIELNAGEGISLSRKAWDRDTSGNKVWSNENDQMLPFLYKDQNDTLISFSGLKLNYPATIQLVAKITTGFDSSTVFNNQNWDGNVASKTFKESVVDIFNPEVYVKQHYVDTLMEQALDDADIAMTFNYSVRNKAGEEIFTSDNWDAKHQKTAYEATLLTDNYFFEPYTLSMQFPEKGGYLLKDSIMFLIVSVIIILSLVTSFLVFVKFLLKQVQLNQMKSNFVNNMTHEFKTPTANISLAVENMEHLNGSVSPKLKKYIRIINEENRRMITNVEKILEVAKYSDKNDVQHRSDPIDINEVLYEVTRNFGYRMDKAGGVFKKLFQAEHHIINGDRHHIKNIISNVLDNALKYSDKEVPEVTLRTEDQKDHIVIVVEDNGPGIDAQDMGRIFDPFYRKDTGNLHDVKGFGLGLSYAKRAAEMHNGKIEVTSKTGKGATFRIVLPVEIKQATHV